MKGREQNGLFYTWLGHYSYMRFFLGSGIRGIRLSDSTLAISCVDWPHSRCDILELDDHTRITGAALRS